MESNGGNVGSHYFRSVMEYNIKARIVTFPPAVRFQLSHFLTKKIMIKDILQRRMIIKNYC